DGEQRAMSEGSNILGGAAVPNPFSSMLIDRARNLSVVMRAGAQIVEMDSQTLDIARITDDVSYEVKSENAQFSGDEIEFDRVSLHAQTIGALVKASLELAEDAPNFETLIEDALAAGLIDSIKHRQDFIAELESRYGKDVEVAVDYAEDDELDMPGDNFFALFEFMMKLFNPAPEKFSKPTIAIVYVEGVIVTGEAEASPFGGQASGAFSTTIRKALDKAADESSVKAVVMRVDSPGGSALASEIILDAAMRVAKKKPLIVSMGNVAGSGGYYVACRAETIFADRATITASIGVIGGKLVTTQMWESLGINWHAVQRGEMAGMMSTASRFSDPQRAKIRDYMSTVYEIFKAHVTAGRGSKLTKPINEIAGGRVFTGKQALELGLVDEIGGLDDAIRYAAKQAGIVDYEIRAIPEPPSIFDMFLGDKKDEKYANVAGTSYGALFKTPIVQAALPTLFSIDPLRARALVQALWRLELIHKEGVVVMMPQEFLIR
ncbi:MAG: signal peptide peptidase SppA, partial [Planctomycetes bacterium]|nr:signal peptide peptidase SppA [Planctomycetota bacterium]